MADYEIGAFGFVNMSQPPVRSAAMAEMEVRPGMDGHAIFYTGTRGTPFQVQTFYDVPSGTAPATVAYAYRQYLNQLATVRYEGTYESNYYQVLDVQILRANDIVAGMGGVNSTSVGKVVARWTLIETQVAVPP